MGTNTEDTLSAKAWMGALDICAFSTSRTIWESAVSEPTLVARTCKPPGPSLVPRREQAGQLLQHRQRVSAGNTPLSYTPSQFLQALEQVQDYRKVHRDARLLEHRTHGNAFTQLYAATVAKMHRELWATGMGLPGLAPAFCYSETHKLICLGIWSRERTLM